MPILANAYYVYALVDPRNEEVFYVGKGKGARISQHVKDVLRGRIVNGEKCLRISRILDDGCSVREEILIDGLSEPEAYRIERGVIRGMRHLGTLTNISSGTVTEEQSIRARMTWLLENMKPYDEWVMTARTAAIDYAVAEYGHPYTFYTKFRDEIQSTLDGPVVLDVECKLIEFNHE